MGPGRAYGKTLVWRPSELWPGPGGGNRARLSLVGRSSSSQLRRKRVRLSGRRLVLPLLRAAEAGRISVILAFLEPKTNVFPVRAIVLWTPLDVDQCRQHLKDHLTGWPGPWYPPHFVSEGYRGSGSGGSFSLRPSTWGKTALGYPHDW
jgi:hypothetical protein